jgi:hypothetical protein
MLELVEIRGVGAAERVRVLDFGFSNDDETERQELARLEHVRDALQERSFSESGPGSMAKLRYAVRPELGEGQSYLPIEARFSK